MCQERIYTEKIVIMWLIWNSLTAEKVNVKNTEIQVL